MKEENTRFAYSFLPGALFVALLCLVSLLSYLTEANLVWLGVLPRNFFGLIGILTSPFIHSGLVHLLSNAFPLILLSGFILFQYRKFSGQVFLLVYILSGVLTWFIGRQAYHIGASGLVYGLAGFLLFNGLIQRDRGSLAVSLAVLFLYGGLFYGLFPNEERISWEGHLAGLLAGLVATFTVDKGAQRLQKPLEYNGYRVQNLDQPHRSTTMCQGPMSIEITYTVVAPSNVQKNMYQYKLDPTDNSKTHSTTLSS